MKYVSKTRAYLIPLTILLSLSPLSSGEQQTISVGSDPWCPYICEYNDGHNGVLVDIAREALAESGIILDFEMINWARAKRMVQLGELDGIIGMSHTEQSETQYHFSNTAIGQSQICFYRRIDDVWEYKNPNSLGDRVVGWINHYLFADETLDEWIEEHKKSDQILPIGGINTHARLLKLLQLSRIDTFAEDKNVIAYEIKKLGFENQFSIAGCLSAIDQTHLAFSLKSLHKEEWAKALETGVEKLRNNGKLDAIHSYYGLTTEN